MSEYKPSDTTPMQLAAIRSCVTGAADEVLMCLSADHFSDERMLSAFESVRQMRLDGYAITPESLGSYMEAERGADDARALIAEAVAMPAGEAKLVIKALTKMRGRQMSADLGEYLLSHQAAKDGMDAILSRINQFTLSFAGMNTEPQQTLVEFMDNIDKPGDKPLIILPGFGELDNHYRIRPGTMNIIGAPPGIGKTACLLNIAANAAEQGHDNLIISLEVPSFDLKARLTAMSAGVSAFRTKEKVLGAAEMAQVQSVAQAHRETLSRVHYIAPAKMHVDALHGEIEKWVATKNIKMVALDYCQRLQAPPKHNGREYERVTYVSEQMTQIAKATGIPIVAASATRRKHADERGGEPSMHDLRSSGAIEFDAHTILMLSRDKDNRNILHADIAKNRDGGLMGIDLYYDFETQRITAV